MYFLSKCFYWLLLFLVNSIHVYNAFWLLSPNTFSVPLARPPNPTPIPTSHSQSFLLGCKTPCLLQKYLRVSAPQDSTQMCQSICIRLVNQPEPGRPVVNLLPWRAQSSAWNGMPDLRLIGRARHGSTSPAQGRWGAERLEWVWGRYSKYPANWGHQVRPSPKHPKYWTPKFLGRVYRCKWDLWKNISASCSCFLKGGYQFTCKKIVIFSTQEILKGCANLRVSGLCMSPVLSSSNLQWSTRFQQCWIFLDGVSSLNAVFLKSAKRLNVS